MNIPSRLTKEEQLEMYRAAYVYHSTKAPDDRSDAENKWLEWVPGRIEELQKEVGI